MKDLTTKIRTFITGWNQRSHPFVWTKTAERILKNADPGHLRRAALVRRPIRTRPRTS